MADWQIDFDAGRYFHITDGGFTTLQHDWAQVDQFIGSGNPVFVSAVLV